MKTLRAHGNNASFIQDILSKGMYTFSFDDFIKWSRKSKTAARAFLRRSIKNGNIICPTQGFYVIVPPEYKSIGCLPPEQFIDDLMQYLNQRYYIGLLSAFALYGISHQQPQTLQVITDKTRKKIACGKVKIDFMKNNSIENIPVNRFKTPRGFIKVSTIEASVIDMFLYPEQAGGLNNVATILKELSSQLTTANMDKIIRLLPNLPVAQRLGYILDRILKKQKLSAPLKLFVDKKVKFNVLLVPSSNKSPSIIDKKWKVFVNANIEADI